MGNLIAVEPTHTRVCATRADCITRLVRRQRHRHKFSSPHTSAAIFALAREEVVVGKEVMVMVMVMGKEVMVGKEVGT